MAAQNTSDQVNPLAKRSVREVYPVSRIIREARLLLEGSFPLIWVEGEISNLAMPGSGHVYFTLKDEIAQVRCAMFRNRNQKLRFTPENGMQVLLRVRITLYEGRGEFQLVVEHMEEAGSGALQKAYEALKQRLGQEGLFDEIHKKSLPAMPASIGIISSPDSAAVHDILSVVKRRFPAVAVIIYPVAVQGEGSAQQLIDALKLADSRKECDLLIMSRGGGSLEDLWSFNDERLARAIYDCDLPLISAVGHEIDFTIADFVADVRAATPSAAAEMAVPEAKQLLATIDHLMQRMTARILQHLSGEQRHLLHLQRRLPRPDLPIRQQDQLLKQFRRMLDAAWLRNQQNRAQKVDYLGARLKHPQSQIEGQFARIDNLRYRLQSAYRSQHKQASQFLAELCSRLSRERPWQHLITQQQYLSELKLQLDKLVQGRLLVAEKSLSQQIRTLKAVSPLNTLERGYAITHRVIDGKVITRSDEVKTGETLRIKLYKGEIDCEVKAVKDK